MFQQNKPLSIKMKLSCRFGFRTSSVDVLICWTLSFAILLNVDDTLCAGEPDPDPEAAAINEEEAAADETGAVCLRRSAPDVVDVAVTAEGILYAMISTESRISPFRWIIPKFAIWTNALSKIQNHSLTDSLKNE